MSQSEKAVSIDHFSFPRYRGDINKYANDVPLKDVGTAPNKMSGKSDGSTASYYELPKGATQLQDIIAYKDMNSQIGEIFRACMRYGKVSHSPKKRDIKKIIFYAQEELKRLENYGE